MSDISWNVSGEEAVREFKKGDEIEAVVLQVDPERERISLGVKQMDSDPFSEYLEANKKGALVKGTIKDVDAKGATVELAADVEGYIRVSDISVDRVEDASTVLTAGEEVEAKFVGVDRKNRVISLSIKAIHQAEEKAAFRQLAKSSS